jgi:hypothetical protein
MPVGVCKLCLQLRELESSHLIQKALYRRFLKQSGETPIVMTPALVTTTSKQVRDFVFCRECEGRFNVGGERYVMSQISDARKSFPLRDTLRGQTPTPVGPFLQFSGHTAGVDANKLAYYAVSMVWRGAVHVWKSMAGQVTGLTVKSYMEEMRRYLLGETPLPANIYVFVLVCLDLVSQVQALSPFPVGGVSEQRFELLVNGIFFQVGIDCPADVISNVCCVQAPGNPIFAGDHAKATLDSLRDMLQKAKVTTNVPATGNVVALVTRPKEND